jgi:heat shock protein HslJ
MRDGSKISLAIIILAAYFLTACDVIGGDTGSSDSAALESKTWVLISYGTEGQLQTVLEGVEITATFNPDEAEVSGSSGCNHYFGDYKVAGSGLSLSNMGWTEMACLTPEGVMEQEQEFLSMFATAESFEIQEDKLIIFTANDQLLKFK